MFFGYCISLEKVLQLAHERPRQIKLPVDESRDFAIIYQYSTSMMTLHNVHC